jgi:hypothetical protein
MKPRIVIIFACLFIFSITPLRPQLKKITKNEFKNIHLHWFPDGKRLISTTNQGSKTHLVEIGDEFSGDYYTCVSPAMENPLPEKQPIPKYLGQKPPGDKPELFAPGIVSTCKEHSSAMFTPNGNEVWFGRLEPAFIYFMEQKNGIWTKPQVAPFSGQFQDLYPVLSFDGKRLFFTSQRPLEKNGKKLPRGTGHIWVSERTQSGWKEPINLGPDINFAKLQSNLCISAKGTVYFNSKDESRPQRSMDIFRSKLENGKYSKPENVEELNSNTPEHSPFIAPDENYIIFSSFRGGYGRSDLFISFRKQDGTWTVPKNMGKNINSSAKDEYPHVSPDGQYLFFNSNRPSALNKKQIPEGPGNIYWVSANIIEKLKLK